MLSKVDTAEWSLVGVADLNGDGTDDIAWRSAGSGIAGYWQINDKKMTDWQTVSTIA
ncbi:MAG: FG-GAP repeat protein [Lentisphaeria bacterium]|nr:FG-GAP repeat protein [Lentisphaeria bacterium]